MDTLNNSPFAGDKVANAFGLHKDGKARIILTALYGGDKGPLIEMMNACASLSPHRVARANGLSVNLVYGLMRPYEAGVHKAIVKVMQEYGLGFRQAATAAGYDPLKALGSVAFDQQAIRAVTGIVRGRYCQGANDGAYAEAVDTYLAD